jgi:magnesium chelatase family protein
LRAAERGVLAKSVGRLVIAGELGDGSVRAVRCVLPAVLAAARAGHRTVVVPTGTAEAAALGGSIEVLAAATLRDLIDHLAGRATLPRDTRRLAAGRRA